MVKVVRLGGPISYQLMADMEPGTFCEGKHTQELYLRLNDDRYGKPKMMHVASKKITDARSIDFGTVVDNLTIHYEV